MFMLFHLMKTYIRNLETEIKLCLCPSTSSKGCAADTSAQIYARGGSFSELGINGNLGRETVEFFFSVFAKKN